MSKDQSIHVHVLQEKDRKALTMRYRDPTTGKHVKRSAETSNRKEAERRAAVWADELNTGRYAKASKSLWSEFRDRCSDEKLTGVRESSRQAYETSLDRFEGVVSPRLLSAVTSDAISRFSAQLRKDGVRESTVARHLRHVKACLRWAYRLGMLTKLPTIEMPRMKGQRLMKGRAITAEEFDRLIAATPKVRKADAADWQRLITGLWLSGLRISEAVALSWDDNAQISVDLGGKHPRLRIHGEAQKSGRDEVLPLAPDFAAWLLQTSEADRQGRVFPLRVTNAEKVSRVVASIGTKARIVTDPEQAKTACAHDLRRSFGTRWAKKVMPAVLRRLMRHAHVSTTMAYYVDMDADQVADDLWRDHAPKTGPEGTILGTTTEKPTSETASEMGSKSL